MYQQFVLSKGTRQWTLTLLQKWANKEVTLYSCLSWKKKKKKKKYLITMGQLKMKDQPQNKFIHCWDFIALKTVFN